MKKILIFLLILFAGLRIQAQTSSVQEANKLYAQKEYQKSAEKYEAIIKNEGAAPELYYNLGNAYFKSDELAKAILNYERALRLFPAYEDAKYNLEFANRKVVDNIEMTDTFFLRKWGNELMKLQTSNAWFYTAVVLFLVALVTFLLFIFGNSIFIRKGSFYIGLICFVFLS